MARPEGLLRETEPGLVGLEVFVAGFYVPDRAGVLGEAIVAAAVAVGCVAWCSEEKLGHVFEEWKGKYGKGFWSGGLVIVGVEKLLTCTLLNMSGCCLLDMDRSG